MSPNSNQKKRPAGKRTTKFEASSANSQHAEQAIQNSEEHFRSIFENSDDAILLTAPEGSIFKANPAACRMFGRSEAEIIKLGRESVIDHADPRLPAALEERKRTGRFKGELTLLRRDGEKFPGELTSVVFQYKAGQGRPGPA